MTTDTSTPDQAIPDLRPQLAEAFSWVAGLVEHTDTTRLEDPTPCDDYTLGLLLLHLDVVAEKVVGLARDGVDPYAATHDLDAEERAREHARLVEERIVGSTGPELARRLLERAAEAAAGWTDERMSRPTTVAWGPTLPGAVVVAIYVFELVAHGWDLAQATGQDCETSPGLAEAALQAAHMSLGPEMPRGAGNGIPFEARQEAPADAGPTTALACFLGRTPMR